MRANRSLRCHAEARDARGSSVPPCGRGPLPETMGTGSRGGHSGARHSDTGRRNAIECLSPYCRERRRVEQVPGVAWPGSAPYPHRPSRAGRRPMKQSRLWYRQLAWVSRAQRSIAHSRGIPVTLPAMFRELSRPSRAAYTRSREAPWRGRGGVVGRRARGVARVDQGKGRSHTCRLESGSTRPSTQHDGMRPCARAGGRLLVPGWASAPKAWCCSRPSRVRIIR